MVNFRYKGPEGCTDGKGPPRPRSQDDAFSRATFCPRSAAGSSRTRSTSILPSMFHLVLADRHFFPGPGRYASCDVTAGEILSLRDAAKQSPFAVEVWLQWCLSYGHRWHFLAVRDKRRHSD